MFQSTRFRIAQYFTFFSLLLSSLYAQAAVNAAVQAVFTDLADDFDTLQGYAWPLFSVIVGGLIVFAIARRLIHAAVGG